MPRKAASALTLTLAQARAHWLRVQGFGAPARAPAALVAATGWVRTFGGVDPYLALRARTPGLARASVDKAVAAGAIKVVPAVRGCMYLVPKADVPLALALAAEFFGARSLRELDKLGVKDKEVAALGRAVLAALGAGPLGTEALRKALPAGAVRSLGEAGRKAGVSSPLPATLRQLELEGQIERTLEGGRLDGERYAWRVSAEIADAELPATAPARHARLAQHFFALAAPARGKDFAAWSGLPAAAVKTALAGAGLAPIAVPGYADDALVPEAALPAMRAAGKDLPPVALLGFEDNLLNLHGGPAPLVDPAHHQRTLPTLPSIERPMPIAELKHLLARPLLIDGELAGLWEYDAGAIVFGTFAPVSPKRRKDIAAAGEDVVRLLREIGHAKGATVDNAAALRARVAFVRGMN